MPYRNPEKPVRVCIEPEIDGPCGNPLCGVLDICCQHLHEYIGQDVLLVRCEICYPKKEPFFVRCLAAMKQWWKNDSD